MNGGCLIFLLMTHGMWVGMHKTSTWEGLRVPKDRSRIQNDLKSDKCSKISSGIQEGQAQEPDALAEASAVWTQDEEQDKSDGVNHSTRQQRQTLAGVGSNPVEMSGEGVQAGRYVMEFSCFVHWWWRPSKTAVSHYGHHPSRNMCTKWRELRRKLQK